MKFHSINLAVTTTTTITFVILIISSCSTVPILNKRQIGYQFSVPGVSEYGNFGGNWGGWCLPNSIGNVGNFGVGSGVLTGVAVDSKQVHSGQDVFQALAGENFGI